MKKNSPSGERPSLGKRKTDNFSKFYNKKRNSAIKEGFRQEKKAAKKERKDSIDRLHEDRRQSRVQPPAPSKPTHSHQNPSQPPGRSVQKAVPGKPSQAAGKPVMAPEKHRVQPSFPGKPGSQAPARPSQAAGQSSQASSAETLPLNKYIAHGGICSRRDAAELVRLGKVTVNGQLVTEPGTKVHPSDTVKVNNKKITISHNFVYILLNKPKDYITTADDPQGRRTVFDLIRPATTERVFPVGRLDRNTSGVLLLTNDGDLAQKLAHPSHQIRKIYHVTLDKPLTKADFDKIAAGTITLEDGPAPVDDLAYADSKDKTQIGLEIHSGRNRIVRRIFEHLGYDVRGLDRVMYAGLTKKNVQRGHWRLLSEKEIRILKYLNSSIKGSPGRAKDLAPSDVAAPPTTKRPHTSYPEPSAIPKKRIAISRSSSAQTPHPDTQNPRSPRTAPERPYQKRLPSPAPEPPHQKRSPSPAPERPYQKRSPSPAPERPHQKRSPSPAPERPYQKRSPSPAPERPHQKRSPRLAPDRANKFDPAPKRHRKPYKK